MSDVQQNGHSIPPNVLVPTGAKEWRKTRKEGVTITLPSGNTATLVPVALDQLVMNGEIPDFLTSIAAKSLWTETDSAAIPEDNDLSSRYLKLIDIIVPLAMLSPKVAILPNEEKGEISIDDIDFVDKVAIFNLAIQPSSVLRNFRKQQEEFMAGVRDGEDDEQSSEHITGN